MTDKPLTIALLGAPNCGKSSIFNALTGGKAKIANYPGVTVEYSKGFFTSKNGVRSRLLDLPGVYGNCGHSADERVTIDAIHGKIPGETKPDGLILVTDAAHIHTHLHTVLQAKDYGLPMLLVLNMMDMAKRDGVKIDIPALQEAIGIPVVGTVAVRSSGRAELLAKLDNWTKDLQQGNLEAPKTTSDDIRDLQKQARAITNKVVEFPTGQTRAERLDNIFLHPVLGIGILVTILVVMFQAVFSWSAPAISLIETGTMTFGEWSGGLLPQGPLRDLYVNGIVGGVGAVLVFLPQILILFAFILALEYSGYMARAAFLVDTLMAKVGLSGRAFIPLLSSFACAVPGIMATRTIENEKDRLTTILIAPLMTCSARLPVYTVIIGAFIPASKVGIFNLQGLVLFALYVFGIVSSLLAAFVLKRTVTKGTVPPLLLELPSYKWPSPKDYFQGLWLRAKIFIRRAGRIILPASIIIWFLSNYPNNDGNIRNSFAGMIGRVLEPILSPIGFNLEMAIALVPAMAAREISISTLAIVYSADGNSSHMLQGALTQDWTLPMALAFLAWFVFAPQCLATLAITRKETHSWKWPIFMFSYLFILAYIAAGLTFHLASWAGL